MKTRDTVKLHPTAIRQAGVLKAMRRRPYRVVGATIGPIEQRQRVPREVLDAARKLAGGDPGRIELLWDRTAIVHNSREERQRWQKIHAQRK